MGPRARKMFSASWLVLAGSSISKGDRCTVKNVKFEGGTGSEDQETDTEDFKI